jgi:CPA2 family monovalent cation:H+ antiporter-2
LFSVSFALGAFFAGTVMRESQFSHRAAQESLPLRDAFAVLFFVSIGMLFDPAILIDQPLRVVGVVAIIILGNSLAALCILIALRFPLKTALTVAVSLGQIGEFSIILAGLGKSVGLLPAEGLNLVLAGVLISITLNSLLFPVVAPLSRWILLHSGLARRLDLRQEPFAELPKGTEEKYLEGQVVLVGYGRVGRRIAQALEEKSIPFVVVDQNRGIVESVRKKGGTAVSGDAADPAVLIQAHIARAGMLVLAMPDTLHVRRMADIAKTLNPGVEVVLRTHSEDESTLFRRDDVGKVFFGEEELANGMTRHIVERFSPQTGDRVLASQ